MRPAHPSLYLLSLVGGLMACGRISFDVVADSGDAGPLSSTARVTVSDYHSCAVDPRGTLRCWGGSYAGEVGLGDYEVHPTPMVIEPIESWRAISSGNETTCGVRTRGDVYCWGSNGDGYLGVGDLDDHIVPTQVAVPDELVDVSSGWGETNGVSASGARWGWGDNRTTGALGVGDAFGPNFDPRLALGDAWVQVAMGSAGHACGIRTDQTLWCWGLNGRYELGLGDTVDRVTPTEVVPGSAWQQVSAGGNHTCAIRGDATLWCWGSARDGRLGDGSLSQAMTPRQVHTGAWKLVAAGFDSTCAIDDRDSLWCWGRNDDGKLGLGDRASRLVPTLVQPGTRWSSVDGSAVGHACGTHVDGSVWCWGRGVDGQLGTGELTDRLVPTPVL